MDDRDHRNALGFHYVAPGAVSIGKIPPPSNIMSNPTYFRKGQSAPLLAPQLPTSVITLQDSNAAGLARCSRTVHDAVHTAQDYSEMKAMNATSRHHPPAAIGSRPHCSSNSSVSRGDARSPDFSLERLPSRHSLASGILSSQPSKSKTQPWLSLRSSKQSGIERSSDDASLKQTTHHSVLSSKNSVNISDPRPIHTAKSSSNELIAPRTPNSYTAQTYALPRTLSNPHLAPEILAASPKVSTVMSSSVASDSLPKTTSPVTITSKPFPAWTSLQRNFSDRGQGGAAGSSHSTVDSTAQPSTSLAADSQSHTVARVVSASVSITSSFSPSAAEVNSHTLPASVQRLDPRLSPRVVATQEPSTDSQEQSSSRLAILNTTSPCGPTRPKQIVLIGNQTDTCMSDLTAIGDTLANCDPIVTSSTLPEAGFDTHPQSSPSNQPLVAAMIPSIYYKTPPAPRLRTSTEVLADSKQLLSFHSEWSSPLTSLASEDDLSEEGDQVQNEIHSRRSKPSGHIWTKALWKSFTETKHKETPEYPAIGQQFESLEAFKQACLLASWPRGHSMHVRNSLKSGSTLKHVLSCSKDRAPPKGCNCTFRIAATFDQSLKTPTWIVTHVFLQHRNHTPKAGGIQSMTGNSTQAQSQVSNPPGRRQNEKHFTSMNNQIDEIVPHQSAPAKVLTNSDPVIKSHTLSKASSERRTRLSLSNKSPLATVTSPITPKTPPPPQLRTKTEVADDRNKVLPWPLEWSSPLTSLASEDDPSEELEKVKKIQSRRSKPNAHQWTKALWESFSDTLLEQAPEYPVVGQQFESLEAYKEACLLASWARGHNMHIRSLQKSSSALKHVLSCSKDRAPPKGCNCTFRIAATLDQSVENPTWIVSHVFLQHHNHNPQPGDIQEAKHNSTHKQSQAGCSSGRGHTEKHSKPTVCLNPLDKKENKRKSRKDSEEEGRQSLLESKEDTQSTLESTQKSSDSPRVAEGTSRTRSSTSKVSRMSMSSVGLRSSKRKRGGLDDTNNRK